ITSDQSSSLLGYSVDGAGDVNGDGYADIIAGAYLYDSPETNEGAAFIFKGGPSGVGSSFPAYYKKLEADSASAYFGMAVAGVGDVNKDGYADVVVGAPYYAKSFTNEGAAFLFLGSSTGPSSTATWQSFGGQASAYYGRALAGLGDLNGDTYPDLAVGAYYYDKGETDEGAVFVYYGSAMGYTGPVWTSEFNQASSYLGQSVAGAGDVNADGYDDVVVGAPYYDGAYTDEGVAMLYLGSASGLLSAPSWMTYGGQASAMYGYYVSGGGDVNADGYDDVLVGAPGYDGTYSNQGKAYLYKGVSGSAGLSATPSWSFPYSYSGAGCGTVAKAGDFNGDGYGDILVGCPSYSGAYPYSGLTYLYFGNSSAVPSTYYTLAATSSQSNSYFGSLVAPAGDVNRDGYDDFLVGAPYYDSTYTDEGALYLYMGSTSTPAIGWNLYGGQAGALAGGAGAGIGDYNGDGYLDVAAGLRGYANGQTGEGQVRVYYGNSISLGSTYTSYEANQANAHFGRSV
ncbi:hypothetical protein FDZ71_06980, partial [bacterium]